MAELIELTELQQVLQDYAREAIEMYRYQISLGGHNASRKLFDSIKTEVVVADKGYEVTMSLEDYWKYIEGGAKGTESSPPGAVYSAHFPPVDALVNWINIKPIIPRPYAGTYPRPEQLAFLIGRKIRKHGIEPYPAMEQTKKELMDIYRDRLSEALGHDVENYIKKLIAE